MKTKTVLLTAFALLLFMSAGCKKQEANITDIYHSWKFIGFGNAINHTFEQTTPSDCEKCYVLTFSTDGKFSGQTTTNGILGEFTINDKNLKIKDVFGTEIAELGSGYKYSNALLLIESYEITKNSLKLYYNQGQDYLLFKINAL